MDGCADISRRRDRQDLATLRATRDRSRLSARVTDGGNILLLGWHGDAIHDALALLLTAREMHASNEGVAIRIFSTDQQRLSAVLSDIASGSDPTADDLHLQPEHVIREKWDWVLPAELSLRSYVSAQLDLAGARQMAVALSQASDAAKITSA